MLKIIISITTFILLLDLWHISDLPKKVSAQTGIVIGAAGDISPANNGAQFQTANIIESFNPSVVLALGDNQYPDGTLATFQQYYNPSWGRFKSKTRPVPGNHDYHVTGAAGYYDYFGALAGDRTKGYYSYNAGGWHFIALNSEQMSTAQNTWLQQDLQANQGTACILAYFHHPRFSSSATHGGDQRRTAPFWELLYQYRADVILTGHNHHYERFAKVNPNNQPDANGLHHFVVGSGGGGIYPFASAFPNSQVRIGTHGVIKMTLNAGNYSWQFINTQGQVLDSGSANCVGGGGAATGTPSAPMTPTRGLTMTPTLRLTTTPTRSITSTPTQTITGTIRPGDVNRDGMVNILDFQILSNAFGKSLGTTGYNARADFNNDNRVDVLDFQILSNNFGR